jgi:hypothetical protein
MPRETSMAAPVSFIRWLSTDPPFVFVKQPSQAFCIKCIRPRPAQVVSESVGSLGRRGDCWEAMLNSDSIHEQPAERQMEVIDVAAPIQFGDHPSVFASCFIPASRSIVVVPWNICAIGESSGLCDARFVTNPIVKASNVNDFWGNLGISCFRNYLRPNLSDCRAQLIVWRHGSFEDRAAMNLQVSDRHGQVIRES